MAEEADIPGLDEDSATKAIADLPAAVSTASSPEYRASSGSTGEGDEEVEEESSRVMSRQSFGDLDAEDVGKCYADDDEDNDGSVLV